MGTSTAPADSGVPDLSFVKDLQPGVAYAVLAVIALGMLLFYLGPGLKSRFGPKPPPEPPPAKPVEQPTGAVPAVVDRAVVDRADVLATQFIDHLVSQNRDLRAELQTVERERDGLRMENERLRDQLWRRGG